MADAFVTKPRAPTSRACSRMRGSSRPLTITTSHPGTRWRINHAVWMPSLFGRTASRRATPGDVRSASATAWNPSRASATTTRSPSLSSARRMASRNSACSSASSIRTLPEFSDMPVPRDRRVMPRLTGRPGRGHPTDDVLRLRRMHDGRSRRRIYAHAGAETVLVARRVASRVRHRSRRGCG